MTDTIASSIMSTDTKGGAKATSKSRDLVKTGPKELHHDKSSRTLLGKGPQELAGKGGQSVSSRKKGTSRGPDGLKPSTSRALMLKNNTKVAGADLFTAKTLPGVEKLSLLADEQVANRAAQLANSEKSMIPLEQLYKMADSQMRVHLHQIETLQDPMYFLDEIQFEIDSHTSGETAKASTQQEKDRVIQKEKETNANIVGACIHNTYMLAAGWRLAAKLLDQIIGCEVEISGSVDSFLNDDKMRNLLLSLHEVLGVLIQMGSKRLQTLAPFTKHFQRYFAIDTHTKQYIANREGLYDMYKSYIDAIVLEILLPDSKYSFETLFTLLEEALKEAPKEEKARFPMAMWNAMGDLAVVVRVEDLLQYHITKSSGNESWRHNPQKMSDEFVRFMSAEQPSLDAVRDIGPFMEVIHPLAKTSTPKTIETLWQRINDNYVTKCGTDIDSLWELNEVRRTQPVWTDNGMALVKFSKKGLGTIKEGTEEKDEDRDSMPDLKSASESDDSDFDDSDYDSENESGESDFGEYDAEENEERYKAYTQANSEYLSNGWDLPGAEIPEPDSANPADTKAQFLKLLKNLKGRLFSPDPAIHIDKKEVKDKKTDFNKSKTSFSVRSILPPLSKLDTSSQSAKKADRAAEPGMSGYGFDEDTTDDDLPDLIPVPNAMRKRAAPAAETSKKTTIEEEEDADDIAQKKKKKSKPSKRKKKKKKATGAATAANADDGEDEDDGEGDVSGGEEEPTKPQTPPPPAADPVVAPPAAPATATQIGTAEKKSSKKKKSGSATTTPVKKPAAVSTTSPSAFDPSTSMMSLNQPGKAQSAHSYLQQEKGEAKEKTKTRSRFGAIFSSFGRKLQKEKEEVKKDPAAVKKNSLLFRFKSAKPKVREYMNQLFGTADDDKKGQAPLKWHHFVMAMEALGFTYDKSSAGSTVRFDHVDKGNASITFHKPHPDPTLPPLRVKQFSAQIRKTYGITVEQFNEAAKSATV